VPRQESQKPRGRDEVVHALLHAAARLFAERGPAGVSLRDVAAEANVNVGLIHRHIGSKEDLVAAVLRERPGFDDLARLTSELTPADLLREVFRGEAQYVGITNVHARMIIDGYAIGDYQDEFPVIDWLVEHLGKELPDDEARLRTALMVALATGWRLFGAEYLDVLGMAHLTPADVVRLAGPALDALVDAPSAVEARRRGARRSGA
jgi:TetR/AcrR family transcriptional regulator, repressor for neighboring sulfatase